MAMTALSSEVSDQLDLLVAERSHLLAINDDGTDKLVFLKYRNAKECPGALEFDRRNTQRFAPGISGFGSEVRDVNDVLGIDQPTNAAPRGRAQWPTLP
jgi:hypothetical protein